VDTAKLLLVQWLLEPNFVTVEPVPIAVECMSWTYLPAEDSKSRFQFSIGLGIR